MAKLQKSIQNKEFPDGCRSVLVGTETRSQAVDAMTQAGLA
jgi:hypothetical protein